VFANGLGTVNPGKAVSAIVLVVVLVLETNASDAP